MAFLIMNIADLPVKIKCCNTLFLKRIRSYYKDFINIKNNVKPVFELQIDIVNKPCENYTISSVLNNTLRKSRLSMWLVNDTMDITIDKHKNVAFLKIRKFDLEYFIITLHIIYFYVLIKNKGVLIHGASIMKNKKGYLFFGPSGSGKTTVSLSFTEGVFHDDFSIIRKAGRKFKIYNAPFSSRDIKNSLPKNESVELKGIFRLIKSKKNKLKRISPLNVLKALSSEKYHFCACTDDLIDKKISKTLHNLVNSVSNYDLYFSKKCDFWRLIDEIR